MIPLGNVAISTQGEIGGMGGRGWVGGGGCGGGVFFFFLSPQTDRGSMKINNVSVPPEVLNSGVQKEEKT